MRLAAIKALRMTVKVPDRAKVKGAGTSAIVDLVGFREDNVLPVAAFYGRGDTTVNYLAEVMCPPYVDDVFVFARGRGSRSLSDSPLIPVGGSTHRRFYNESTSSAVRS